MRAPAAPRTSGRLGTDLLWVGAGIATFGLATFAFLAVAGTTMGRGPSYTALALVWTLLNAVGIGLYLPVEQETSRTVSAHRTRGLPTAPAARRPARYAAVSLAVVAAVAAAAGRPLADLFLEGDLALTWSLAAGLAGMAVAYLARGVLAGNGRFARYGTQLAVDGGLRMAAVLAFAAAGVTDPVPYALTLAVAPVLATGVVLLRPGRLLTPGDAPPPAPMAGLVVASATSQLLANAGPIAVQLLRTADEAGAAGNFVNALTVARVPLFLFAAVQAVFLPRLAAHVAAGDHRRFVADVRSATLWTGAIGVAGTVGAAALGPWAVPVLFGPTFAVTRGDITVLALSAGLFMNAQVLVQALLARSHDRAAILSWSAGLLGLAAALAVQLPLSTRVAVALVAGAAGALVTAALALSPALRRTEEVRGDA